MSRERKQRRIMWQNRFSGETGFVKAVKETKGYFENGTLSEARKFRSDGECNQAIAILNKIGEGANNDFIITDENGTAVGI